ncbi:hypothetical protein OSB04_012479 [Centaurea solstitialis]|uniref:Uncharacterized protein n=1 Tax=Centaurea solstitialis TaxID=347529 RepID=A0AA38TBF5_9ASTR|nr:hypothetical protein OSB04_012479 [Centaurea solstitialis]
MWIFGGSEIGICRWQSSCIVAVFMSAQACLPLRCCAGGGVGLPSLGEELRGPDVICESVREEWSDKRVRNPYLFSSSFQRNAREERKRRIGSGSKEFNRRFVVIDCVINHVSCAKSHPATEDFGSAVVFGNGGWLMVVGGGDWWQRWMVMKIEEWRKRKMKIWRKRKEMMKMGGGV